ncbi:MAG TPA: SDR family NAD(P)-dependent oxidoreductase [Terriglobales bacterium]|nr:SDR family NAD(P)-dependent oxidoreductase [Terriglobales bacterium]
MRRDACLRGRHAIVTGGGRGIGAAVARALAELGADLSLMGRDMDRLHDTAEAIRNQFDSRVETHHVDVTDLSSVQRAFTAATAPLGCVYILVNNAGQARARGFADIDPDHWQNMIDANLSSAFYCTQQVLPAMAGAGEGRVVNIASTAGLKGYPKIAAYCAAKHGLIGFTRSLALEYAKSGVTINAVCPGYTETEMFDRAVQELVTSLGKSPEEARAMLTRPNPQGRVVKPEEVADAVAWLCSPGASAITGQAIAVAGGEVM